MRTETFSPQGPEQVCVTWWLPCKFLTVWLKGSFCLRGNRQTCHSGTASILNLLSPTGSARSGIAASPGFFLETTRVPACPCPSPQPLQSLGQTPQVGSCGARCCKTHLELLPFGFIILIVLQFILEPAVIFHYIRTFMFLKGAGMVVGVYLNSWSLAIHLRCQSSQIRKWMSTCVSFVMDC